GAVPDRREQGAVQRGGAQREEQPRQHAGPGEQRAEREEHEIGLAAPGRRRRQLRRKRMAERRRGGHLQITTASFAPASTPSPSCAWSSATTPAFGLFSSFSIFIASTTTRGCPSATRSPCFASTRTTLPCMGESTRCGPSRLNLPEALRRRSFCSSRRTSSCT